MGLFSDFAVNAKDVASKVGEKASHKYDIVKLNSIRSRTKAQLDRQLSSLGKKFYDAKKAEKPDSCDYSNELKAIDDLYAQLKSLDMQIAAAQNKAVCYSCGATVDRSDVFCPKCGAALNNSAD